jgi:RNA polymerase sigma factor (TIGR02999 family)
MADPAVTQILSELQQGNASASERLLPLVYEELRRLARKKMAQEVSHHTLQPTALVHEAYLRLVGNDQSKWWDSRGHFYSAAAEAIRRILIESARRKSSSKHGGGRQRQPLMDDEVAEELPTSPDSLLSLDDALKKLEQEDPDAFRLVMLRYFGGLTIEEAAAAMGVSVRTAKRNWSFARAWLQREIGEDS